MITSVKDYFKRKIPPADICIVGTGPAGIDIANYFSGTSHSVTLIEGGFLDFDWQTQNLDRFQQIGLTIRSMDSAEPYSLEQARNQLPHVRQFGGSLNVWGGVWKALDSYDFEEKPYFQDVSWPISKKDLSTYYASIAKDYDILDLLLHENISERVVPTAIARLDGFRPTIAYKEKPALNIRDKFYEKIKHSSNIRLILGANAVDIRLSEDLKRTSSLTIRSIEGNEWPVKAKIFILACGTVGNARLLLNSNTQIKSGVGNENDLVGRYLMDHPKGAGGVFFPTSPNTYVPEAYYHYKPDRKQFRIGISLSRDVLRQCELPNHYVQLFPLYRKGEKASLQPNKFGMIFFIDQLPNPESRMFLTEAVDEVGMRIPCLDWRFKEQDYSCFKRFVEKLQSQFLSHQLGEIGFIEGLFEMNFLADSSHQMGTTRMGRNPQEGVVDANGKVFGIDNLYVTGCSVFPTGGNANPTFTVLALSRRLANYLLKNL